MMLNEMSEKELNELKLHPVGYQLQKLRWRRSLTQQAFAALIDCDQSSVSAWERGMYVPSNKFLDKICRFYGLPEDFFQKSETTEEDETVCV